MLVRWQKRTRRYQRFGGRSGPDVHWSAHLVETLQIDGKPKQRPLAYLGSISDSALELYAKRAFFWQVAMQELDRVDGRLLKDERARIERTIAQKVPPLTRKEYRAWIASLAAFKKEWGEFPSAPIPSFTICGQSKTRK